MYNTQSNRAVHEDYQRVAVSSRVLIPDRIPDPTKSKDDFPYVVFRRANFDETAIMNDFWAISDNWNATEAHTLTNNTWKLLPRVNEQNTRGLHSVHRLTYYHTLSISRPTTAQYLTHVLTIRCHVSELRPCHDQYSVRVNRETIEILRYHRDRELKFTLDTGNRE